MLLTLVAATAVYTSLTVSPAAAADAHGHDAASHEECYQFDSVSMLGTAASAARGADSREPVLNQVAEEVPASAKGKGGKGFSASVLVYFHVVTPDGVTGNVTLSQINEQIRVMNAGFSGAEGGVDTGFRFRLAGVDRTVNAEWFNAGPTTKGERDMKKTLKQGGPNALNYYSTTAGIYLGWAYFPNVVENATAYLDGIVVDWESMPGTSTRYAGQYDLGKTERTRRATGSTCTTRSTAAATTGVTTSTTRRRRASPRSAAPKGQDSCREPGLDPIHNYMDYSFDSCYNQFTSGQAARRQDAWLHWRA